MIGCIVGIIGCIVILGSGPDYMTDTRKVNHLLFLPVIAKYNLVQIPYRNDCGLSKAEEELFLLVVGDADQLRTNVRCDPLLSEAARGRADDMATRLDEMKALLGTPV